MGEDFCEDFISKINLSSAIFLPLNIHFTNRTQEQLITSTLQEEKSAAASTTQKMSSSLSGTAHDMILSH